MSFDSSRRNLLKGAATAAAAVPFVGALQALSTRTAHARPAHAGRPVQAGVSPYGPIAPVADLATGLELLQLPAGFQYKSFSWTGDLMENGQPVPGSHDGMGVVEVRRGGGLGKEIVLVRNHERGTGSMIDAMGQYDTVAFANGNRIAGGTTNLYVPWDMDKPVRTEPSLGGTRTNCAGGVTPWGTWLTCEENTSDDTNSGGQKHGYVFEVTADPRHTSARPIVGMGRMKHEAVAVDPANSNVYLTEDQGGASGYYRFVPANKGQRHGTLEDGGTLYAAKIKAVHQGDGDLRIPALGDEYELEWVHITNPDAAPGTVNTGSNRTASGPFIEAYGKGAAPMQRGEGIWYFEGKMYVVDTSAGAAGEGAVWEHDLATDRLRCIFVSPHGSIANSPDNVTVSPRGGVLLCEDGGASVDVYGDGARLLGLQGNGDAYIFAKNNVNLLGMDNALAALGKSVPATDRRSSEFAGACFDPSGHYLFVNIQSPGITFAIWGPWGRGTI